MFKGIFDSHAHYTDKKFDHDRDELLKKIHSEGVENILTIGDSVRESAAAVELAKKYPFVYAAVGVHPHEAGEVGENYISEIEQLSLNEKAVAIGEIGLDYHYDFSPRDTQKKVFEEQLVLAARLNIPVIIHDREAHADTLELLKKYRPKGVVHCFSGSAEMAREVLKIGMYVGFTGAVTFKNAQKPLLAAAAVPLERLLIETDCPYMAPEPFRGRRCDSSLIPYTAQALANIKGVEPQTIIDVTAENARRLFGLREI